MTKKYPNIKVWVNDLYEPLVNFWIQLRDNAHEIKRQLQELKQRHPDPTSARVLFEDAKRYLSLEPGECDAAARAVSFYVVNKCSFSGLTESSSFSKQASDSNFSFRGIEKLPFYSQLIRNWKITNLSYEHLMDNEWDTFVYLEDGDFAVLKPSGFQIFDESGAPITREKTRLKGGDNQTDRGEFEHYMLKEIYEQPDRLRDTLTFDVLDDSLFGDQAAAIFDQVQAVQIIACGTSYHAGLVARHWLEAIAGVPCQVEVASEFRYRRSVALPGTLVVTISQSGETADTLAAIKHLPDDYALAKLAICNVDHSAIVRASDLVFLTKAGPEIGVASTKAFTTQLAALMVLMACIARRQTKNALDESLVKQAIAELPAAVEATIAQDAKIKSLASHFIQRNHALFLGRGVYHPIAMEGALKLKEISYIHAEAYPAGELKHGPLALVDDKMPIVAVAPKDDLLDKLKSNLEEVRARGGQLFVFADQAVGYESGPGVTVIDVPSVSELAGPIVYTVVLQLLSYHVAVAKGTDVDKPRNLAKSVTVE